MIHITPQVQRGSEVKGVATLRCPAIGNSFHTSTAAILLGQVLAAMKLKEARGQRRLRKVHSHVNEALKIPAQGRA